MSDQPPPEPAGDQPPPKEASASRKPDSLVGKTLAGRFEILEPIARGGMGTIYLARQQPLGRRCAVKTMLPTFDDDLSREFRRRFFKEAATAARLTHPNTVNVYDYGHEGDLYFIAMEYVEGRTIEEVLAQHGPLDPRRTIRIAMEVARSVREAHSLGVIHRDLKPANIAIVDHDEEQDRIKVLDFGLVKSVTGSNADTVTTGGLCVGSPSYMAPEQVDGDDTFPATDIYSLGAVVFEMLTGRPPFVKTSKYSLVMAHLSEPPPALRDVNPNGLFPRGLEEVVARCLEKAPSDRFRGLDELLDELHCVAQGKAVSTETKRRGAAKHSKDRGADERSDAIVAPSDTPQATSTAASVLDTVTLRPARKRSAMRRLLPWLVLGGGTLAAAGVAVLVAGSAHEEIASGPRPARSKAIVVRPPSPPPALSAAVPDVPVPPAASRTVRIDTTPPGATVREDGQVCCASTPCDAVFPTGPGGKGIPHDVEISLIGYRTTTVKIASSEQSVKVGLERDAQRGNEPSTEASPKPTATGFNLSPY